MAATSPNTTPTMSPEQIDQDIAALQATLISLADRIKNLGDDIPQITDVFESTKDLQRGFTAVCRPLAGCVADCQEVTNTFHSLNHVLKQVQDLTAENKNLQRRMRDETNYAAVTTAINSSRDTIIQSFERTVAAESHTASLQAQVDMLKKQEEYLKAIQLSTEERAELESPRREHRRA